MTEPKRSFDLIVYGATSFVGKILTAYLTDYLKNENSESLTWAIAGRNEKKLLSLKDEHAIPDLPHFVVDADDLDGLSDLASKTKVIITTVGPYALYGEAMVQACVNTGTDYCDLCGEPQWIKSMLDKYESTAKQTGARIINSAGFDSIPSDIGVYRTQQLSIKKTGQAAKHIKMRVRKIKGAASGGTIASMLNVFKEAKENPSLRKVLVDPYVLCPDSHGFSVRQTNHKKAQYDDRLRIWTMPFVMAAINERIVHRTNALLNNEYGLEFKYDEAMSGKTGIQAWTFTLGLGAFVMAASITPLRNLLAKYVLPKPGEGPTPDEQLSGMFDLRFYAELNNNDLLIVKVEGDRDPGYGSTAKMLAQAAICLAKDVPNLEGGFWTPASAMNEHLIERLAKHAGVTVTTL